jgi:hypothetical protein
MMLKHALKEWAVICRALADGRQSLILRKGGLAEPGGEFQIEQKQFWLYPTYVHQQRAGIKPEALPLLEQAQAANPPPGTIRLTHFAHVVGIYHLHDMVGTLRLSPFHIYSEETVHSRFRYNTPGLYAMVLRVYRASQVIELPESERYAGCRSWVELDRAEPTEGARPVLDDKAFDHLVRDVDHLLNPAAFA